VLKIRHSDVKTNAFGGLNFIHPMILKSGLCEIINESFGDRVNQAKYSIEDIFVTHALSIFAGSKRLGHAEFFKKDLDNVKGVTIPSPDTTSRVLRKLAVPNIEIPYDGKNKVHVLNYNEKMLDVLIKSALKFGLIDPNGENVLDYDNTVLFVKKYDATTTFKTSDKKHQKGYQPSVASINGVPIFVEGRSGHTSAAFQLDETLRRCIETCDKHGIKISKFRSDAAGYNKSVFSLCDEYGIDFFIRKRMTGSEKATLELSTAPEDWTPVKIKEINYEFLDMDFRATKMKKSYRAVCQKKVMKDESPHFFGILTTNEEMTSEEVVQFYNMRAQEEKRFAELNGEFNFKRVPFSLIEENTVFMILTCITYNLYKHLTNELKDKTSKVYPNMWLRIFRKEFIFHTVIILASGVIEIASPTPDTYLLFSKIFDGF